MFDLFLSECRRFRKPALIVAAIHLLLQLQINHNAGFLEMTWFFHLPAEIICVALAAAFGFYQFHSYLKTGYWIWLMHRPLPRARIFGALLMAASALLLFCIGLPALLALLALDHLTNFVVDQRHYLMVVHAVLLSLCGWLAVAYALVSKRGAAIVICLFPFLLAVHLSYGYLMVPLAALGVTTLTLLAFTAFRSERTQPPSGDIALFAGALPLQIGLHCVLIAAGTLLFALLQNWFGIYPNQPPSMVTIPAARLAVEFDEFGRQIFLDGMLGVNTAQATHVRMQLAKALPNPISLWKEFPLRQQMSNANWGGRANTVWYDFPQQIVWTFSHDAMRFRGHDLLTGADRGWFGLQGVGDRQPFPEIPALESSDPPNGMLSKQAWYMFDATGKRLTQEYALTGNEVFIGSGIGILFKNQYLLTNRRLIALAKNAPGRAPLFSIDLPPSGSLYESVHLAELADGVLISLNSGRHLPDGAAAGTQTIVHVDAAGVAHTIAERPLRHSYPLLYEHRHWWPSPLLSALLALPDHLIDTGSTDPFNWYALKRPPQVVAAAIVCALLASLGAWVWLRRTDATLRRKRLWLAACLVFGPAGLLSLMILQKRAPLPRAAPAHAPRTAAVA